MGKNKKKSGTPSSTAPETVAIDDVERTPQVDTPPHDNGRIGTPMEEEVEVNRVVVVAKDADSGSSKEGAVEDQPKSIEHNAAITDEHPEQQATDQDPSQETVAEPLPQSTSDTSFDEPTSQPQSRLPAPGENIQEGDGVNGETANAPKTIHVTTMADEAEEEEGEGDEEDDAALISRLEQELEATRAEKEQLGTKYSNLLSKLTMMRQSLGDRLREDAEELDRREAQISQLQEDLSAAKESIGTLQEELQSSAEECTQLSNQVTQLRLSASTQTSDVLSLTREMRELRGEMEMMRVDREEWEHEAGRERERREAMEEEMRSADRQRREDEARRKSAEEELERERVRANNLQEVLAEFQSAKDLEIQQATLELENQLRQAVQSLAEWKSRAADAEVKMTNASSDLSKTIQLEKEIKDKNAQIGRLRHEGMPVKVPHQCRLTTNTDLVSRHILAVLTQEHLTEALRRLRRNTSDVNVDRRLVTNVLLQFIATPRADPKRFEMLSLLATILSWEDSERERAGLQRAGGSSATPGKKGSAKRKESDTSQAPGQSKTQQEQDEFNESFSDLFVEFLLKEAAQGQKQSPLANQQSALPSPGLGGTASPPIIGNSGVGLFGRQRTYSNSSMASNVSGSFPQRPNFSTMNSHQHPLQTPNGNMTLNLNLSSGMRSPQYMGGMARKGSFSAQHLLGGAVGDRGVDMFPRRDTLTSPRNSIGGPSWHS
ncbi:hypothetical protein QFC19_002560 [Naganishia cerealis]|uniref:Uncharacterized protein n=1 Tax=Naganishia cerealis TaxID=610337 RepID=A0ACC2W9V2_9TREE|nr:hypothetical protein QFC19_002560 [Naganishia cerealis]